MDSFWCNVYGMYDDLCLQNAGQDLRIAMKEARLRETSSLSLLVFARGNLYLCVYVCVCVYRYVRSCMYMFVNMYIHRHM